MSPQSVKYKIINMKKHGKCGVNCENCKELFEISDYIKVFDFRGSNAVYCSGFFGSLMRIKDKIIFLVDKNSPISETIKLLKLDTVIKVISSTEHIDEHNI